MYGHQELPSCGCANSVIIIFPAATGAPAVSTRPHDWQRHGMAKKRGVTRAMALQARAILQSADADTHVYAFAVYMQREWEAARGRKTP